MVDEVGDSVVWCRCMAVWGEVVCGVCAGVLCVGGLVGGGGGGCGVVGGVGWGDVVWL